MHPLQRRTASPDAASKQGGARGYPDSAGRAEDAGVEEQVRRASRNRRNFLAGSKHTRGQTRPLQGSREGTARARFDGRGPQHAQDGRVAGRGASRQETSLGLREVSSMNIQPEFANSIRGGSQTALTAPPANRSYRHQQGL